MSQADHTFAYRGYWTGVFIEEVVRGFESSYRIYVGESFPHDAAPMYLGKCGVLPTREAAIERAVTAAKARIDVVRGGKGGGQ